MERQPLTEARYAWLAGLIDGDGCLSFHQGGGVFLEITMTDRRTIDFLQATFGGRIHTPTTPRPNARQYWKWVVGKGWLIDHLHLIIPHMVTKQPRAILVEEYLMLMPGRGYRNTVEQANRMEEIRVEVRRMNARGVQPQAPTG